jgi:hypothetical protein
MSALIRNKWLSLSLLAIILPISILTTLKFSGLLVQPQPETIMVDAVDWEMERPLYTVNMAENVKIIYADDVVSASLRLLS